MTVSRNPEQTEAGQHNDRDQTIRVVTYNILDGAPDDRWRAQRGLLRSMAPDILLLQEAKDWDRDDFARLYATADALAMQPLLARSASHACHIAIFHRWPQVRCMRWAPDAGCGSFHHTLARAQLRIHGIPTEITLLGVHLNPFSGAARLREASWLTEYAAPGRLTILAGDLNTIGADDDEPDWSVLPPHLRSRHLIVSPDGRLGATDRRATRLLADAGYLDPPVCLGRPILRTTGYFHSDELVDRRSDFILVSPRLASALADHRVVDDEASRAASDHLPVVVDLDPTRIR